MFEYLIVDTVLVLQDKYMTKVPKLTPDSTLDGADTKSASANKSTSAEVLPTLWFSVGTDAGASRRPNKSNSLVLPAADSAKVQKHARKSKYRVFN